MKIKFNEIANFVAGQSPKSEYYSEYEGTPFLQGNRTFGIFYPKIDTYTKKVTKIAHKGDILMSVRAPVGDLNFAPVDVCIGRGLASVTAKDGDNAFLFYALKYNINNLVKQSNGTTYDSVTGDIVKNMDMIIPENKAMCKRISKLLYSLDSKIENNNKIISELEQMVKTIYDYWFLQYEFPYGDDKPYKSSGGKMIWNDGLKKEIPEGWECKKIEEIEDDIVTGKTPSTKDEGNFNGNIPFITIDDIRQGLYVSRTVRTLSEKGANSQIKKYIPKDSICVTCIATVGLVGITTKDSQTNQQINSIVCKDKNNLYYLVNAIEDYFRYSSGAKSGNIFDNMNKEDFATIKLIYPTESILEKYKKIVEPIYNKIKSCIIENEELVELRNFLLPLLMNGQAKIKN